MTGSYEPFLRISILKYWSEKLYNGPATEEPVSTFGTKSTNGVQEE